MMKLGCKVSKKSLPIRVVPVLLAVILAFGTVGIAIAGDKKEVWAGQITSEDQLNSVFPDTIFRKAVFEAVKNGKDNAQGTTLEEALANFRGDITYSGKNKKDDEKIKSVEGMQYLRKINVLDVSENEITDLSFLEKGDLDGLVSDANKEYYAFAQSDADADSTIGAREEGNNVFWEFGKNPIQNIPRNFGGRVVIGQMQRTSYTYSENLCDDIIFVRGDKANLSGTLDIGKIKIDNGRYITLNSVLPLKQEDPNILEIAGWDKTSNSEANFKNLTKSGVQMIACGTEQEFHYQTCDEFGTITPGSVSYKYYLQPKFYVYDKVDVTSAYTGSVVLAKIDDENKAVPGAKYELFKEDATKIDKGELVTGADGKLTITGLTAGSYYLKEVQAPKGYVLDSTPVEFTLTAPAITLTGGEKNITDSEGTKYSAGSNEVFITGGVAHQGTDAYKPTADITLSASEGASVSKVVVTYDSLDGVKIIRDTFATLEEAQNDINAEKLANRITGAVHVDVEFGGTDNAEKVLHKNVKETTTVEETTEETTNDTEPTSISDQTTRTTSSNEESTTANTESTSAAAKKKPNGNSPKTGDLAFSSIAPLVMLSVSGAFLLVSVNKIKKKHAK